jgi:TetR/AcrR family transcriptional regulator, transcriptional repressor for nem operon
VARTKEFDPEAALQAALELFWRHDYEAISMARPVEHLGIGRASVYATFGNKRELYLKAYDRYLRNSPDVVDLLSQPGPMLAAVPALVERYTEESVHDSMHRGCLVVNTAVELAPHNRRPRSGWSPTETTWRPR